MSRSAAGFPCPQCASPTRVTETRYRHLTCVRRRKCLDPNCGHKFRSKEAVELAASGAARTH